MEVTGIGDQLIDWGVAALALAGEAQIGDRYLVKSFQNGVLVAMVDGLGHGTEAAEAAKTAIATAERHAREPLTSLLELCHESLRRTRGVVMSLASINALDEMLTWLGVGNIESVLVRTDVNAPAREWLLLRGGVVGYRLPPLKASVLSIKPGDTLILATDGIRGGFAEDLDLSDAPQQIADRILDRFAKGTDDALVLVVRYIGFGHEQQNA